MLCVLCFALAVPIVVQGHKWAKLVLLFLEALTALGQDLLAPIQSATAEASCEQQGTEGES
eukprot:2294700-Amphidinium_carterae.1